MVLRSSVRYLGAVDGWCCWRRRANHHTTNTLSEHGNGTARSGSASNSPTRRQGRSLALMAEDTDRGCLVLFGGVAYRRQYCDTWEYGPDRP